VLGKTVLIPALSIALGGPAPVKFVNSAKPRHPVVVTVPTVYRRRL